MLIYHMIIIFFYIFLSSNYITKILPKIIIYNSTKYINYFYNNYL